MCKKYSNVLQIVSIFLGVSVRVCVQAWILNFSIHWLTHTTHALTSLRIHIHIDTESGMVFNSHYKIFVLSFSHSLRFCFHYSSPHGAATETYHKIWHLTWFSSSFQHSNGYVFLEQLKRMKIYHCLLRIQKNYFELCSFEQWVIESKKPQNSKRIILLYGWKKQWKIVCKHVVFFFLNDRQASNYKWNLNVRLFDANEK